MCGQGISKVTVLRGEENAKEVTGFLSCNENPGADGHKSVCLARTKVPGKLVSWAQSPNELGRKNCPRSNCELPSYAFGFLQSSVFLCRSDPFFTARSFGSVIWIKKRQESKVLPKKKPTETMFSSCICQIRYTTWSCLGFPLIPFQHLVSYLSPETAPGLAKVCDVFPVAKSGHLTPPITLSSLGFWDAPLC